LCDAGYRPAILIRGYGAAVNAPLWVDPSQHTIDDCGDEALMLAESRDVLVAPDRVAGAHVISLRGIHDVILMDDGMQNPFISKTLSIGIFDGSVGIGNGFLIPAGPMRVSLASGVKQMDIALINGDDETNIAAKLPPGLKRFNASLLPDQTIIDALGDTPILAFAGIGQPKRFFATLRKAGCNLAHYLAFADHHPYSETDLVRLQEDAMRLGAQLVTTQKDWVRLPAEWRERIVVLPVALAIDDDGALCADVEAAISAHQNS
jgi:tetraacyldisaccharide 4'-kinase